MQVLICGFLLYCNQETPASARYQTAQSGNLRPPKYTCIMVYLCRNQSSASPQSARLFYLRAGYVNRKVFRSSTQVQLQLRYVFYAISFAVVPNRQVMSSFFVCFVRYALNYCRCVGHTCIMVYLCNVRSVLEYAAQVWQDIPFRCYRVYTKKSFENNISYF